MSGVNAPYGLRPVKYLNGATWNNQAPSAQYFIQPGYATSIFKGDPVTIVGGYVTPYTPSSGATVPIQGVFWGCEYTDITGKPVPSPFWQASTSTKANTLITAFIIDDPMVLFSIQSNSATGLQATTIMKNAPLVTGTGNTNTGVSGYTLGTPVVAAPTSDVKVYGLDGGIPNGWTTTGPSGTQYSYNNILVKINNHVFSNGTYGSAS